MLRLTAPLRLLRAAAAAPRKPSLAAKPRFAGAKKPSGAKGGLGVKKMTTKVDDALFEQAPAEDPSPPAAISAIAHSLTVRARFGPLHAPLVRLQGSLLWEASIPMVQHAAGPVRGGRAVLCAALPCSVRPGQLSDAWGCLCLILR